MNGLNKGFIYALLTMIIWGIGPVFAKLGVRNISAIAAFEIRSIGVFIFFFIFSVINGHLFTYHRLLTENWKYTLFLFIEGFCGAFLGQITYYHAQKYWETSKAVVVVSAFPIVAMILASFILHESLSLKKLLGALLVISGIFLIK